MDHPPLPEFFYEIFDASLPRLGPGDPASTERALEKLRPLLASRQSAGLRILDLGCGNGAPTLILARRLDGRILAVDNHQPYLDELRRRAEAAGVADKIETRCQDMRDVSPAAGPFDLIWSEGALFVMGFLDGIAACHRLLAPGGLLACTELCWFADPPAECRDSFAELYPAITGIDANLAAITARGFTILGHFPLPESAWRDHYYHPLEKRLATLRPLHAADRAKLDLITTIQAEIDLYRQYSRFHGYVFFLMRKAESWSLLQKSESSAASLAASCKTGD